ncbi:MAG: response regulator [Verrucomicrobiia bacterium]
MEPIAILASENAVLLSRMTNDLCQSKYRVSHLRDPSELLAAAREQHPMFVVLDLDLRNRDAVSVLAQLKSDPELRHTLVLAFADGANEPLLEEARAAGADMVTTRDAVSNHLLPLVEQLLGV